MHARVVVLAQDLIWSDRLARAVEAAGGEPIRVGSQVALVAAIPDAAGLVVDLTARAYDGLVAIATGRTAGLRVLAVGQHDDVALRKRALAAGAERVYAYRKLFEDGPATIAAWLAAAAPLRS